MWLLVLSFLTSRPSSMMSVEDYNRWRIALYYCYIDIADVRSHVAFQQTTCSALHLTGRIRVAPEGINGVLSGEHDRLREYEIALHDELKAACCFREEDEVGFELDVKFCRLREDLPVRDQLFDTLLVQETKRVVSLVDEPSQRPKRGRTKDAKPDYSDIQEIWEAVRKETVVTGDSHLSPAEWDRKLAAIGPHESAILLDCRNSYESAVGYFEAPNATTLLTNTRKYSELPGVFLEQRERLKSCTHVFAYCTGGVRCEVASKFLRRLLEDDPSSGGGSGSRPEIFQLHGGIQRYLEQHEQEGAAPLQDEKSSSHENYFKGKNFVFDPRRTDPIHGATQVGQCVVCGTPHDDYDNGHAPAAGTGESRCVNCRVLLLVCPTCRPTVTCWGQDKHPGRDEIAESKPKLYCGGLHGPCLHKPPVRLVVNAESVAL